MAFILSSACRRRSSLHHLRHLFSTSTTTAGAETPSPLPIVTDSIFCHESDPTRFISTLFSVPDRTCARYAADQALHRLSRSLNFTSRSDLLDSFLPLASSEQDFASLLISYGSAILPEKALSAFRHRLATGGPLSVSTLSFNALLSAFIRSRRHQEVQDLFVLICEEHSISPDVVSYGLLVRAFFLSNRSTDAFATLKQISDEQGIVMTDQIYRLLLVSLHGHGKTEEANQLWNEMVSNGVQLDCIAYNVKVWYHAIRGETERIYEIISEMEALGVEGVRPDTITYNYLIGCLCKNDRVEDVKVVYKMMVSKKQGCSPNATTFLKVLCCLCRFGDFETGVEVFRDAVRSNKVPHCRALRELVEGLAKEGKVEAAKEVVKNVPKKVQVILTRQLMKVEKELVTGCQSGSNLNQISSVTPSPNPHFLQNPTSVSSNDAQGREGANGEEACEREAREGGEGPCCEEAVCVEDGSEGRRRGEEEEGKGHGDLQVEKRSSPGAEGGEEEEEEGSLGAEAGASRHQYL